MVLFLFAWLFSLMLDLLAIRSLSHQRKDLQVLLLRHHLRILQRKDPKSARSLDRLLIISEAHLRRVLTEYIDFYNHHRARQGIDQQVPVPLTEKRPAMDARGGSIRRRDVLGGIIHDYYRADIRAA